MFGISMTPDIILVLTILVSAILLFISNKVRMDLVGLLVMASLAISGLITPSQALSGFSNPAVITVWTVLILSGALARTGVASKLGKFFLQLAGDSEVKLLTIIMLTSGILSGFMNSIGVTSLFLPVLIDISRRTKRPPSKLLIPLAFSALLGGLNTLIGTPSNILISEALSEAGFKPFQMFDFTPIGLTILVFGTLYMVLIGRHLLPKRDPSRELASGIPGVTDLYDFQERMVFIHLPENSSLDGKSLEESHFGSALELNVVSILRGQQTILAPGPDLILRSGDRLLVEGQLDRLFEIYSPDHQFLDQESLPIEKIYSAEIKLAEVTIPSGSSLIDSTLPQVAFRHVYNLIVLAIRREDITYYTDLEDLPLRESDVLLVKGRQSDLNVLNVDKDTILSIPDSFQDYNLEDHLMMVRVPEGSALAGNSIISSRIGDAFGLSIQGIIRKDKTELMPSPEEILEVGDTLIVKGKIEDLHTIQGLQNLLIEADTQPDLTELETDETGLIEAVLSPRSTLTGKAIRELDFRARYGLTILAIWREGRAYRSHLRDMKLRLGDALLLFGPRRRLRQFGAEPEFLVLSEEAQPAPRSKKAPLAITIMLLVLLPVILNWIPISISAIAGVTLMILTGCLRMDEAYQLIEWKAVFLIAGMLPLGIALEQTGAAQLISNNLLSLVGNTGPIIITSALILLSTLSSQIMPNPAVAVLLAPIALSAASNLGISPYPLMMAVAVSSSAVFLSPVGHPANLLVMGPGGYRFSDYFKVGIPLTVIVWLVVVFALPLFWPF
jgi:di/tricarboxylate transporter